MWERVFEIFGRRRRQWRLSNGDDVMECFIVDCPGGVELRFEYCGELYHQFVHRSRRDAEREAVEKREEMLRVGWCEQV
jgi:hypothetical protein